MSVLGVKYFSKHLAQVGKKDTTFISQVFNTYLEKYDTKTSQTDLVFFHGASNVQMTGQIVDVYYLQINVLRDANHVQSLFYLTLQNPQLSG